MTTCLTTIQDMIILDITGTKGEYEWLAYHSFLDANHLIDCSDLPTDEKDKEKEKFLDSRKEVFGKSFENYPPWKK